MKQTIRDTAFGHLVRFASRGKFLKYPEEADPSLCQDFIDPTKSGNLADHGTTGPREEGAEQEEVGGNGQQDSQSAQKTASRPSSSRQLSKEKGESDDSTINEPSGVRIDPEKGKDAHLVTWRGQDDPDNPQNWSRFKRCFVTFQICLLTMSVYIGSAIYSAGTQDVMQTFGVSQVAATLGLCLYVAGYGLGPLVWSPMSEIPQIGREYTHS
jgi:DHA1 family multidrug resistance protein-like MFS transporter